MQNLLNILEIFEFGKNLSPETCVAGSQTVRDENGKCYYFVIY